MQYTLTILYMLYISKSSKRIPSTCICSAFRPVLFGCSALGSVPFCFYGKVAALRYQSRIGEARCSEGLLGNWLAIFNDPSAVAADETAT